MPINADCSHGTVHDPFAGRRMMNGVVMVVQIDFHKHQLFSLVKI